MTIQQAMTAAMKHFNKERPEATILRVSLSEASGKFDARVIISALIHIEYIIDNDFNESNNHPTYVRVEDVNGEATAQYIFSRSLNCDL